MIYSRSQDSGNSSIHGYNYCNKGAMCNITIRTIEYAFAILMLFYVTSVESSENKCDRCEKITRAIQNKNDALIGQLMLGPLSNNKLLAQKEADSITKLMLFFGMGLDNDIYVIAEGYYQLYLQSRTLMDSSISKIPYSDQKRIKNIIRDFSRSQSR